MLEKSWGDFKHLSMCDKYTFITLRLKLFYFIEAHPI